MVQAENLAWLRRQPAEPYQLVYVDPPFNTGSTQRLQRRRSTRDEEGTPGFGGRRYATTLLEERSFPDRFEDYVTFLRERVAACLRLLAPDASLFVHVDPRESHYVKVMLDELLGRDSFMNEIVWAYDYGGRARRRWSAKHDVILWYAVDPGNYRYDYDAIDRVPYMAPTLVSPEKAARGKTPTDVWWNTIVSPTGKERTGYPTQKPLAILERIVRVHSRPGDRVLDFFAGSGTTGEAAWRLGRSAVLVDENPEAVKVMRARLAAARPKVRRSRAR
ncbi:MAG: site-specific DNA-methyltransferase [Planctomycetes bacterium]|nr:site-specific DNA-methyltransferase [Planctomycetota bacterium]